MTFLQLTLLQGFFRTLSQLHPKVLGLKKKKKSDTVRTEIGKSEKLRLNQTIWRAFAGQKVPKQQSKMGLGLRGVGIDDGMWDGCRPEN